MGYKSRSREKMNRHSIEIENILYCQNFIKWEWLMIVFRV